MKKTALFFVLIVSAIFSNAQTLTTFAGGGTGGVGDGGPAVLAKIPNPIHHDFDKKGNLYIASALGGHRIRKVDTDGIITTIAGTGTSGFGGDGGLATMAMLSLPAGVALDSAQNIFIADAQNHRIRKINAVTGVISTVVGNGVGGYAGDGGSALSAQIHVPNDICFDSRGNYYIADNFNARVRKVTPAGIISTIAGTGIPGYDGDGRRADTSRIGGIGSLCVDKFDNLYLADGSNTRVFKINVAGIITTFAGTDTGYLYNGDGIPATQANIYPIGVAVDSFGRVFITENLNYRVRMVDTDGIIHTVAGTGTAGYSGDGGPAIDGQFNYPSGLTLDKCGNLYISDAGNARVRKVTYEPICKYDTALGTPDLTAIEHVKILPNPASDFVIVKGLVNDADYLLTELTGRIVASGILKKSEDRIDINGIPPGLYLLRLTGQGGSGTYKVVKE